jgi:hypothetical protein
MANQHLCGTPETATILCAFKTMPILKIIEKLLRDGPPVDESIPWSMPAPAAPSQCHHWSLGLDGPALSIRKFSKDPYK